MLVSTSLPAGRQVRQDRDLSVRGNQLSRVPKGRGEQNETKKEMCYDTSQKRSLDHDQG